MAAPVGHARWRASTKACARACRTRRRRAAEDARGAGRRDGALAEGVTAAATQRSGARVSFDPAATRAAAGSAASPCRSSASACAPFGSTARDGFRRIGRRGVRRGCTPPACAISTPRRSTASASPSIGWARACGSVDRRDDRALDARSAACCGRWPAARRTARAAAHRRSRSRYDYSYDGTLRSLEHSLQRLGTNAIDIVLIHDVNRRWQGDLVEQRYREAMDGAHRALRRAARRRARSRRSASASTTGASCERFAADGDFDCFMLAGRYTLLDHTRARHVHARLRAPRHLGADGGAVQLGHPRHRRDDRARRSSTRRAEPRSCARTQRIEAVCARHGVALAAAALQFPLAHPAVASVVTGMRNAHEVGRQPRALPRAQFPRAFWDELKHEGLIAADAPVPAGA